MFYAGATGELTSLLGSQGINIAQIISTAKGKISYNVIDIENLESVEKADALQKVLLEVPSVVSSRIIWTGSSTGGPSSFSTKWN